jgi:hypothetical protein
MVFGGKFPWKWQFFNISFYIRRRSKDDMLRNRSIFARRLEAEQIFQCVSFSFFSLSPLKSPCNTPAWSTYPKMNFPKEIFGRFASEDGLELGNRSFSWIYRSIKPGQSFSSCTSTRLQLAIRLTWMNPNRAHPQHFQHRRATTQLCGEKKKTLAARV